MANPILTAAIERLADGEDLSAADAARVLREVMEGNASEAQAAALLIALRTKGETVAEITGLARTMRELATPVEVDGADLVDTAGTGGGPPTFNVSTTAAFVAAGAGCRGGKDGNRAATGRCGAGRRARGSGRPHRPRAAGRGRVHRSGGLRLHVRSQPPQRHAPRGAGAQGAGRAHGVQLPRPADQSRGRDAPGDRRLRRWLP